MVSRQKQSRRGGAQVANRKSKHTVQPLYAIRAFFFIQMNHNFSVCIGSKTMSLGAELLPQFREGIYLPVERNPHTTIFITHRHVAVGREINNGQSPAAQA